MSPRASSRPALSGKGLSGLVVVGEEEGWRGVVRSEREISTMPTMEAKTPSSLRQVNFSVCVQAPMRSVQIEDVDVRMVAEATFVC